jgi:3-isopropylmalate dehydrogenase
MKTHEIILLPGDGVGPEVTAAARLVLEMVADCFGHRFHFTSHLIGGEAIEACGDPLPPETLAACRESSAIFLGAVGGPQWDRGPRRPEEGLLSLRKELGLFTNLRPVSVSPATAAHSPLRPDIVKGVDMLIVRELTGGIYFGERKREADWASDLCVYSVGEIERVARVAFRAAADRHNHVTSIDKANVMETSRLWRETVTRLHKAEFPSVRLEHQLVDSAAMSLIQKPRAFDVILTENMFGDILSDEASVLTGSIGLLPSASLSESGPGIFEPIHGSAPDIAGRNLANPVGAILSAAMLLRHGLGMKTEAEYVEDAVRSVLGAGRGTRDIGGDLTCSAFARVTADAMRGARWSAMHMRQMHWA